MSDAKGWNDPLVVCVHVNNSITSTDVRVPVPWNDVRCTYIYSAVATAVDATGDMVIDFEFNAAGGTRFATMTIAASAAIGDIDEATFVDPKTAALFTEKSYVNIEIDGSATGTGSANIFMYFEPIL
jgi:hypothetical protein